MTIIQTHIHIAVTANGRKSVRNASLVGSRWCFHDVCRLPSPMASRMGYMHMLSITVSIDSPTPRVTQPPPHPHTRSLSSKYSNTDLYHSVTHFTEFQVDNERGEEIVSKIKRFYVHT